jgi:hypothetical protein
MIAVLTEHRKKTLPGKTEGGRLSYGGDPGAVLNVKGC